jgi:hypothetical protein
MLWRQWLPTPPHPCRFVMPPVCLVCELLSNYLLACSCVTAGLTSMIAAASLPSLLSIYLFPLPRTLVAYTWC